MSLTIANLDHLIDINNNLLTVKQLLVVVNYTFNGLYIDRFWDNIENDKWIYIDDNMLEWLGYNRSEFKKNKQDYLNLIKDNFEENTDYKIMCSKEFNDFSKCHLLALRKEDINTHNKVKHLVISPDCFKQSLMLLRTNKSKEIRKYYTELEKIFKFYLQYQNKYQELKNLETKQLLEAEKNKNTNLTNNAIDYNQLIKKEYLYIATNTRYASQNNFKIGKTNDLKQRLSQYNTSHNKREPYYYVFISEPTYYAKSIEYIIKHILTKFKNSDTNELFVVHYTFLEKIVKNICENYNASIDYYNICIQEEMNNMSNIPVIPKDVFNINDTDEQEEVKEMEYQGKTVEIEYYDNNKEYEFIRFKTKDKNMNYKCNRCNHIFNRIDHIQLHFQRMQKCFDSSKNEKIENLKKNKDSPIMKYYRDNQEYNYYETFLEDVDSINYHCGRCGYETTNLPSIKRHFDRKVKCYEVKTYGEFDPNNIEIEISNNNKNHQFYRFMEDGAVNLQCNHCNYKTIVMGNLNRHFKGKKKCWENKD
jgi:DNA-directed RNA polymerase subunit RPC12/RpoP